jgi:hypothetical protein
MILKDLGITCFTMQHVDKYGIGRVMEMTMDQLHGRPIHCSYDIGLASCCVWRRGGVVDHSRKMSSGAPCCLLVFSLLLLAWD